LKPGRRGGKPATNRLRYGAALNVYLLILAFFSLREFFFLPFGLMVVLKYPCFVFSDGIM
jgi:hypothetical protein